MKLYSNVLSIFIIWLTSILFISYVGFFTLPHSSRFDNDFLSSFSNWDGGHFLGIAKFGYSEKFQYAFFPLYPLTISFLNKIINNYLLSAIIISVSSTFIGVQLLYKLICIYFDKKIAEKAIFALLFFPTSFYFLLAYSEGLFFLLTIATFYFLSKHKLLLATVFASLASVTRLVGLAVVVGLLVEVITVYGVNKKNWFILLSPLGFFVYCWYLYSQSGDPFYFLSAELHWQRSINLPFINFWDAIKNISDIDFLTKNFTAFLDLIFAIIGVGLSIRSFRFLPASLSIYFLISILLPLFTPTLASIPRFLLPIFPIFILIGLFKNKFLILSYQVFSIMLLSALTMLFVNGYWVS